MKISILLAALAATATAKYHGPKPHIFFVLVDDFGWSNSGLHHRGEGSATFSEVVTPVMHALVQEGAKLRRHYTYNYCSPSRSSLQSGRLPVHVSIQDDDPIIFNPDDMMSGFSGIPRNMTGMATLMKRGGYRTHATGKWDAGMATWDHTPMGRGYETYYGYFHHANDYWTQKITLASTGKPDLCSKQGLELVDLYNNTGGATNNGTGYEEELFTAHTLKVIEDHDPKEPLFLFHAFHIVHTPLQVPQEYEVRFSFLENEDRRKYASMVAYADEALGRMVGAFKKKGMWENTLLVLSSDNGGPIYGGKQTFGVFAGANNIPLKGGKFSDWEGGIRVNAFISGGFIPVHRRGTNIDEYIHICDWYATFAEIAGVDHTDHRAKAAGLPAVDAISHLDTILKGGHASRKEMHISRYTLVVGDHKLIMGGDNDFLPWKFPKDHPFTEYVMFSDYFPGWGPYPDPGMLKFRWCGNGCLYNIKEDPTEKHDIAKHHPLMVKEMKCRLAKLNKSIFWPARGEPAQLACDEGVKAGGYYVPFVKGPAHNPSKHEVGMNIPQLMSFE